MRPPEDETDELVGLKQVVKPSLVSNKNITSPQNLLDRVSYLSRTLSQTKMFEVNGNNRLSSGGAGSHSVNPFLSQVNTKNQ